MYYTQTTNSITISVTPQYNEEQSKPFDNLYVWEYHINIKNNNIKTTQLINRRWVIIDDNGQIQEASGPGVVGVQPILHTGEQFEYTSFVHLNTTSGVMMGAYEMVTTDEELLEIEIPTFSLDSPHTKKLIN